MRPPPSHVLSAALTGLGATWRVAVEGSVHREALAGRPFVFALWHHTLLPLLWWHRARDITLLVSRHQDGELVARAAARLGYRLARGSSTRGGVAGYRGVLRALASGAVVAVTPDGPHGPAGVVKPGVVRAAHRAGVPILPVSAHADRAWRLRSWDRLLVPAPFARISIRYGVPVAPGPDAAAAGRALGRALDALGRPTVAEAA